MSRHLLLPCTQQDTTQLTSSAWQDITACSCGAVYTIEHPLLNWKYSILKQTYGGLVSAIFPQQAFTKLPIKDSLLTFFLSIFPSFFLSFFLLLLSPLHSTSFLLLLLLPAFFISFQTSLPSSFQVFLSPFFRFHVLSFYFCPYNRFYSRFPSLFFTCPLLSSTYLHFFLLPRTSHRGRSRHRTEQTIRPQRHFSRTEQKRIPRHRPPCH